MAAQALGLAADQLTVTDGVVHPRSPTPSSGISYAQLIGGRYFDSKVKWNGKLERLGVDVKRR